MQQIPEVSQSVLSHDATCDCGQGKTLRDSVCIIPKAFPGASPASDKSQGASERFISIVLWLLNSRRRAIKGIGQDGSGCVCEGGGLLRPYSSLPDCIATQACLQSLPIPTAHYDQIRVPSRCGSARGQEDTQRGQW